jgi:exo-beta-1,3-glucanase (GH17 family)
MVVYSPDPDADARTITAALTLLRQNFDSLSLYSCTSQTTTIVEVAQQLHYQAVLLTVWDPRSEAELAIASSLVRDHAKDLILAVSIGSEGLMQKRYTLDDMMAARAELLDRNISSTAVEMTTTEPWWLYMKDDQAALRDFGEFTSVNVHVVWDTDLKSPAMAAQWTRDRAEEVRSKVGKSLLLRESGFPGGGHSPREGLELTFTREMQAEFWRAWLLLPQRPASAVFEGVDNPSKHWRGFESEWGLVSADLQPWPAWSVFSTPAASPQR